MLNNRILFPLIPVCFSLICFCGSHSNSKSQKQSAQTVADKSISDSSQNSGSLEADTSFSLMKFESLGKIILGISGDSVLAYFQEPDIRGPIHLLPAIGSYVQEWDYQNLGITLEMASDDSLGLKRVLSVSATTPCSLSTKKGIKIGSDISSVEKAYENFKNKENSKENTSFVAGSIYGGLVFSIENGKVSKIFIGASAE